MTVKNRDLLRSAISGNLADNGTGSIQAVHIREQMIDVIDSVGNFASGSQDIASSGDAVGGTGAVPLLWSPEHIKAAINQFGGTGDNINTISQLTENIDASD